MGIHEYSSAICPYSSARCDSTIACSSRKRWARGQRDSAPGSYLNTTSLCPKLSVYRPAARNTGRATQSARSQRTRRGNDRAAVANRREELRDERCGVRGWCRGGSPANPEYHPPGEAETVEHRRGDAGLQHRQVIFRTSGRILHGLTAALTRLWQLPCHPRGFRVS